MDLNTLYLVSTMKTELLSIAMMIETDNRYTREDIKKSLLDLIDKELEGYEVSLLYRDTNKEWDGVALLTLLFFLEVKILSVSVSKMMVFE